MTTVFNMPLFLRAINSISLEDAEGPRSILEAKSTRVRKNGDESEGQVGPPPNSGATEQVEWLAWVRCLKMDWFPGS